MYISIGAAYIDTYLYMYRSCMYMYRSLKYTHTCIHV